MAKELKGWSSVPAKVDYMQDMTNSLKNTLFNCGYKNVSDRFSNNCTKRAIKLKDKIINKIGGIELYNILEMDIDIHDDETLLKFSEAVAKMQEQSWGHMADNKYSHEQISCALNDFDVLVSIIGMSSDSSKISKLKDYFGELEFVSRLRGTLPKETKVVSNILTYIVNKHNLGSNIEKMIPSVIDTLGSNKKKQYIVILSTAPSSIYTASVSDYFNSCYDIRSGGHCYCSSVSYLALDENTAIIKIFEANDENMKLLNEGGIGALSSSKKALARRFVFFKDTSDNSDSIVVLGKAYPNENQLDGAFFSKEILKLYGKVDTQDIDTCSLFDHDYYKSIQYSSYFLGYKDLLEKGGVVAHKKSISKQETITKFDKLKIAYNGICTIDSGDFIAYSNSQSSIGMCCSNRYDEDYDVDEDNDIDY